MDDAYLPFTDPARVGITLFLCTADDLAAGDAAAELQAEIDAMNAEAAESQQGGMQEMDSMESLLDATYTNLTIAGVQATSNGVDLTIGLPGGWSNRLDVIVSTNLSIPAWELLTTLDEATNGISFTWVDTNAYSMMRRFYVLGNADLDSDNDGIPDAIEKWVWGIVPGSLDTDSDGISDWDEVNVTHTDPDNPDTNAPTIFIQSPASGTEVVWVP